MTKYVLPELSYDYGALEPNISGRIMELHHDKASLGLRQWSQLSA